MSRRKSRRVLSVDELKIWRQVTKSVTPLPGKTVADDPDSAENALQSAKESGKEQSQKESKTGKGVHNAKIKPDKRFSDLRHRGHLPLVEMESKSRRRVVRGQTAIDGRIDLHGYNQHDAHLALRGFLRQAQLLGYRTVLVISGKGLRPNVARRLREDDFFDPARDQERGVLRRQVPKWLKEPDMRHIVLGYETAHITHGGEGAFYVRLRKKK